MLVVLTLLSFLLFSKCEESFENLDNGSGEELFNLVQSNSASVLADTLTDATKSASERIIHPSLAPLLEEMLKGYDDTTWPTYETGEPTAVDINVHILRIGSFDAAYMEYTMGIYLRQEWTDPRLSLSKYGIRTELTLPAERFLQRIWKPDIFFLNAKSSNFHSVTAPNKLLKLSPEGRIFTSIRLSLRLSCHMEFQRFPLDTQNCSVIFGPFAQPSQVTALRWRADNPLTNEELMQPEFEISSMVPLHFLRRMSVTGNFTFLKIEFLLSRRSGFHLVQTYLPTFIIVAISWVSFWLNPDATPARVTLGVTTLLALTTVASGVRTKLPPVSYVKAIDVWMGTCSVMVFGALLEFTLANYMSRCKANPKSMSETTVSPKSETQWKTEESTTMAKKSGNTGEQTRTEGEPGFNGRAEAIKKHNESRAKRVDQASRFIFPFVFLIFNVTYWTYYLHYIE